MPAKRKAAKQATKEDDKQNGDAATVVDAKDVKTDAPAPAAAASAADAAPAENGSKRPKRAASGGKAAATAAAATKEQTKSDDSSSAAAGGGGGGGAADTAASAGSGSGGGVKPQAGWASLTQSSTATGSPVPEAWKWNGTLLYWIHPESKGNSKLATYDFDGCLAATNMMKKGADAWKPLNDGVIPKLKAAAADGYRLAIFTNQSDIGRAAKPDGRQKQIAEKIGRLSAFVKLSGMPISIFIATVKAPPKTDRKSAFAYDAYRKPATGMWRFLVESCNDGIEPDMKASFFVGDAAGRKGDHSDTDLGFAKNVGLTFHTETQYFPK